MAKDKKSFILYCDQISSFEKMTDTEAGRLIKHISKYVNDQNPEPIDRITELLFEPIKLQLKRDLKKYENVITKAQENGRKGAQKRWENKAEIVKAKIPIAKIAKAKQPIAEIAVTVTDTVNDTEKKEEREREATISEISYREFDHLKMTMTEFNRLHEKYKKEDIDHVLDKIENWPKNTTKKSLNLTCQVWLRGEKDIFPRGKGPDKFTAFN